MGSEAEVGPELAARHPRAAEQDMGSRNLHVSTAGLEVGKSVLWQRDGVTARVHTAERPSGMLTVRCRFVPDRVAFLKERCDGRSVLHVGFADALFYEENLATGRHLHEALRAVGAPGAVFGVDRNEATVQMFRDKWGDSSLLVGDAENLEGLELAREFDVVVAGELIEHLNNPGRFLSGVKRFLAPTGRLVLTTPNALGLKFFLHAVAGRDRSHCDHSLMFSFSTMETILGRYGFEVVEWYTSMEIFESRRNRRARVALRWLFQGLPILAETLIVVARARSDVARCQGGASLVE